MVAWFVGFFLKKPYAQHVLKIVYTTIMIKINDVHLLVQIPPTLWSETLTEWSFTIFTRMYCYVVWCVTESVEMVYWCSSRMPVNIAQ